MYVGVYIYIYGHVYKAGLLIDGWLFVYHQISTYTSKYLVHIMNWREYSILQYDHRHDKHEW